MTHRPLGFQLWALCFQPSYMIYEPSAMNRLILHRRLKYPLPRFWQELSGLSGAKAAFKIFAVLTKTGYGPTRGESSHALRRTPHPRHRVSSGLTTPIATCQTLTGPENTDWVTSDLDQIEHSIPAWTVRYDSHPIFPWQISNIRRFPRLKSDTFWPFLMK